MKKLKWLYPGMLIKRWISLSIFGILMISMGFVIVIFEKSPENKATAGLIIILGIMCVIFSVKRVLKSFMVVLMPQGAGDKLVDKIYEKRILEKGPKIVVIGGGTGLSTLLTGLKQSTKNLTAIVTVADEGGSSGRLREEFGVLPPGDIRNCIVALADSEDLLGALFQFRFKEGKELEGHNFGNLFITALSKVTGDFAKAIRESSKVLNIRGNVYPATLEKVRLTAKRQDGRIVEGEAHIREITDSPIESLTLKPLHCQATSESLAAIRDAEIVIFGPGSLYTSVMPNLLIKDIRDEVLKSGAIKIYCCNVMTEAGETDHYSVSDHVRALVKHTSHKIMDYCVANISRIPGGLYEKYMEKGQYPVVIDEEDEKWFKREKITLVKAHVASIKEFVRHDPVKLSEIILNIYNDEKRK